MGDENTVQKRKDLVELGHFCRKELPRRSEVESAGARGSLDIQSAFEGGLGSPSCKIVFDVLQSTSE